MGATGIFRFFARRFLELAVVVLLLLFMPNLPPYTKIEEPFSVTPTRKLEGKLALKERLSDVEIWHKGDLTGPEGFAEYNGELYASLSSGGIVKLTGEHITPVVRLGKPCKGAYEERICGRPLGMQFDKNGMLVVADAYYGLFRVNVKTGDKELLVSPDQEIEGKKTKIFNSVALASNGDIYWSASSTEFTLEDGVLDLLADPSGRLLHYDAKTKTNRVLIDKLHFANGVQLSDDEEFVIVAETHRNRIHRYYLKGSKKGTHDIFIDGLPGMPDNLKSDGKGGFFVPLVISVDSNNTAPSQLIGPYPWVRKVAARFLGVLELGFATVDKYYSNVFSQKAVHSIGHFTSTLSLFKASRTTILHISKNGEIIDCLHHLSGKISHICEAHIHKDTLYLGSPFNDYIARIPLSKIGWQHLGSKAATQKPTPTTHKPTTTTPKPTTQKETTTPKPTTTTAPPRKQTPPAKEQVPPTQKQTPTQKPAPAIQKETPPTQKQTPPAQKQAPPTQKQAPPAQKQAPPAQKQAVPAQKQAPPAQKQAPPAQKQAPSEQTKIPPTAKQTTPPSKQEAKPTPSPKKEL